MDTSVIEDNRERLLKSIPVVNSYISRFGNIHFLWSGAITAGLIETGGMSDEASLLFSPLIKDMGATQARYGETQKQLVDAILFEMVKKTVLELSDAAKFAINILKRNLFERTADVGYLATDAEIIRFLKEADPERDPARLREQAGVLRGRLADYQREYTVYDEILILDIQGRVLANLDPGNGAACVADALVGEALSRKGDPPYVESYGESDLRQGAGRVLLYGQRIQEPDCAAPLGVLCLSFDFRDEMERIFLDLGQGNSRIVVAIVDASGKVMACNRSGLFSPGVQVPVDLESGFRLLDFGQRTYLVSMVATDGYQGFMGLTWYALAMVDLEGAFRTGSTRSALDQALDGEIKSLSSDLDAIRHASEELLERMKLDGINGQVKASRFEARGFVEVLHFVAWIGEEINGLFASAVRELQDTVLASLLGNVQFRAFQGNNIADRNLYERANDVCWWALTPRFRQLLARHRGCPLDAGELASLSGSLQYINNLYTPYLRLVLADQDGVVLAVSEPPEGVEERILDPGLPRGQAFVGQRLDPVLVKAALGLGSSRDYCVSDFTPSSLYGGRPTYVFSTAVRDPEDERSPVGVIQIVFDAEPQFRAMLEDILPRDENRRPLDGSFAVFVDRERRIVASTCPDHRVGGLLPLEDEGFRLPRGERCSRLIQLEGVSYVMGLQVSEGYREYKREDGHCNDLICMVFVPI
nr:cache domain-containing protein [uncultured Holophaga sp.]